MPWKDGSLTRGELAFSEAFVKLGNREEAEKAAGLTPGYGYKVLLRPEVQREIRAREEARLISEGLPVGLDALIDVAKNPKSPAASRVAAGKALLDRALGAPGDSTAKEPHEMDAADIDKAIAQALAKLEGMAAARAKPVSGPDPFE